MFKNLTLARVKGLTSAGDLGVAARDAFDADVAMRCGALRLLLADRITALGGEMSHD